MFLQFSFSIQQLMFSLPMNTRRRGRCSFTDHSSLIKGQTPVILVSHDAWKATSWTAVLITRELSRRGSLNNGTEVDSLEAIRSYQMIGRTNDENERPWFNTNLTCCGTRTLYHQRAFPLSSYTKNINWRTDTECYCLENQITV